jgi:transcriptional regulator with XRE-family HTH domain
MHSDATSVNPVSASDVDDSEEDSPFAAWLRTEREKQGLSQVELAQRAGLSSQQVSNIETGRTRNPQVATRDKLAKALGGKPPDAVVSAEEKQVSISGLGALIGFEPYDDDSLPAVRGVYVFYDRTKRPVYVGRATKRTIDLRVREHAEKFWFKRPVVQSASYLEISDEALCKQTEQILIKFMRTHLLLNKQGVEADTDEESSAGE